MCGFLFVVSRNKPVDEVRFRHALDSMIHRGPDYCGVSFEQKAVRTPLGEQSVYCAFGHQRLAILDLDPRSNQPYTKRSSNLLYNGEVYNYRQLRAEPSLTQTEFVTDGDTELVYEALDQNKLELFEQFNGFWSVAFFDQDRNRVVISRDRYGKKPCFFYQDDEFLIVSSTAAAISQIIEQPLRFDRAQLLGFMAHGVMYPGGGHQTPYQSIQQMPPGHHGFFDLANWSLQVQPYHSFQQAAQNAPVDIAETLRDSVRLRLTSDRNVGLLLSGGVDSTAVLAALYSEGLHKNLTCFIGETGRSEDAEYAHQCASQLGIDATVISLEYDANAFQRFLKMCRHFEKPFPILGNSMAMSEMYERIAEHDVTVVIDGTGGDEIFGGYWDRQFPTAVQDARRAGDWAWLWQARKVGKPFRRALGGAAVSDALRSVALALPFVKHRSNAVRDYCSNDVLNAESLEPLDRRFDTLCDLLVTDASQGRLTEWLLHNDRNAMMSSLENRSPLLDYRLISHMGTGYARKFVGEWNKHDLRQAFDGLVRLPTQWRSQKQGFRWASKRFYQENKSSIAELIHGSAILREVMAVDRFCDDLMGSERLVNGRLAQRAVAIAGLEQELGVRT